MFLTYYISVTVILVEMVNTVTSRTLWNTTGIPVQIQPLIDVIFPDSSEVQTHRPFQLDDTPTCANSSTFCEHLNNYPHDQVQTLLEQHFAKTRLFSVIDEDPELDHRQDDFQGDENLCASFRKIIFPKIAKNKLNKWRYIINQQEIDGFVQGIQIETCREHGSACSIIGDVPTGYRTFCKQKYIHRKLLALDEDGVPITDTFILPSACCCSYKREVNFAARFGQSFPNFNQRKFS